MENILIVIQARQGSTRLPNKVLFDIDEDKVIKKLWDRLGDKYEKVVVTGDKELNMDLIQYCEDNEIDIVDGMEENVLSRFRKVAKSYKADWIIRITSDCPLLSLYEIEYSLRYYEDSVKFNNVEYDYITTVNRYPQGFDIQIFKTEVLYSKYAHKEHVIDPYSKIKRLDIPNLFYDDETQYRLTLDYKEDFEVIHKIFNSGKSIKNMYEVLDFIKQTPEIKEQCLSNSKKFGGREGANER